MKRREFLTGAAAGVFLLGIAGGAAAMEQRISVITLGVKSLANAKRFYVDGLGWTPGFENNEIIFFQAGGMIFGLFPRDALAKDFQGDARAYGRAAMSLGYNVREKGEVDAVMKRAAAAGAHILQPSGEKSWGGYSGYFADPDDFAWEVAWNPAWRIAADGSVALG
jgi:uncharacterized protein